MTKDNLKDEIVDGELDLSLNNLTTVPVKDLVPLTKATRLDLSCNLLKTLPDDFCSLRYLIKIDLSKNYLESLPDNFGSLVNLQHLDLLGNKLTLLPVTFFKLQKLKWLDLKDNPLEEELKKVAGDCLDEAQCKKCATQVVKYMSQMNDMLLNFRKQQEKERKQLEEFEKQKLKDELDKKREEKKRKRAEKRKDYDMKKKDEATVAEKKIKETVTETVAETINDAPYKAAPTKSSSFCGRVFKCITIFLTFMLILDLFLHGCKQNPSYSICEAVHYKTYIQPYQSQLETYIREKCPASLQYHDNTLAGFDYIWYYIRTHASLIIGLSSSNDSMLLKQDGKRTFTSTTEDVDSGSKRKMTDSADSQRKKTQSSDNPSVGKTTNSESPESAMKEKMPPDDLKKESKTERPKSVEEEIESTKDKRQPSDDMQKESQRDKPKSAVEVPKDKKQPSNNMKEESLTEKPKSAEEALKDKKQPSNNMKEESRTEKPKSTEKSPESTKVKSQASDDAKTESQTERKKSAKEESPNLTKENKETHESPIQKTE